MSNLVQVEANNMLAASLGITAYSAAATPMKLALDSAVGSNIAAGTEISGGSYVRASMAGAFGAVSAGSVTNSAGAISFTSMPAVTVTSCEIFDSTGTPVRKWFGTLTASKTTNAGDTLTFATSSITVSIS